MTKRQKTAITVRYDSDVVEAMNKLNETSREPQGAFLQRILVEYLQKQGHWPVVVKAVILALLVAGSLVFLYARLHTPHMTSEIYRIAER